MWMVQIDQRETHAQDMFFNPHHILRVDNNRILDTWVILFKSGSVIAASNIGWLNRVLVPKYATIGAKDDEYLYIGKSYLPVIDIETIAFVGLRVQIKTQFGQTHDYTLNDWLERKPMTFTQTWGGLHESLELHEEGNEEPHDEEFVEDFDEVAAEKEYIDEMFRSETRPGWGM